MLPQRYRLKRARDFARVRRFGRQARTDLMTLYVLQMRSPETRIGFSVSKKVGKAVIRNRVKRRLREAVRGELDNLYPGLDLVFIAKPAAAEASYNELAEDVRAVLDRRGALCRSVATTRHA